MEQKKSGAGQLGTDIGTGIAKGLHFAADLAEAGTKGAIKGVGDTLSLIGDVGAKGTDLVTNLATLGHGTNLDEGEGWIDKGNKEMARRLDESNLIDSEWGKTKAGQGALKVADIAGNIASPGGIWTKAFKGLKIGTKALKALKSTPAAAKELEALAKLGNKIEQSQVDEIIGKYAPDVISKATSMVGKSTKMPDVLTKMLETKTPEEVTLIVSKYPGLAAKMKSFSEGLKKTGENVQKVVGGGVAGAATMQQNNDTGISIPDADANDNELKKAEAELPTEDGDEKDGGGVYGPGKTNANFEAKVVDIPATERKSEAGSKVDMNSPDEKKAIASFEELKKENPNLNIAQSISDYMRARKLDSSFDNRAKLAKEFGIKNYMGTGAQNIELFKIIKEQEDSALTM